MHVPQRTGIAICIVRREEILDRSRVEHNEVAVLGRQTSQRVSNEFHH